MTTIQRRKSKHRFALLSVCAIVLVSLATTQPDSFSSTTFRSKDSLPVDTGTVAPDNQASPSIIAANGANTGTPSHASSSISSSLPPLETMEDAEMLSYFVMWNYYGRFRLLEPSQEEDEESHDSAKPSSNSASSAGSPSSFDQKPINQTLRFSEFALHQFLDDLRNSKLDQRKLRTASQPMNLNCARLEAPFYRRLQAQYPGELYRKRMQALCEAATQCHSTEAMLALIRGHPLKSLPVAGGASSTAGVGSEEIRFSQSIVRLCPLILFQLQDQNCTAKREQDLNMHLPRPSTGSVWGFSFLFVTIISFCSLIGVTVLPFTSRSSYQNALNLFEGLAVGSLVGSALFHLIPQSFNLVSLQDDYLWKALTIFAGIYLFFWSELLMKTITELRRRTKIKVRNEKSTTSAGMPNEADLPPKKVLFAHKPSRSAPTDDLNGFVNDLDQTRDTIHSTHRTPEAPIELSLERLPLSSSPTSEYHLRHHHQQHRRQDDSPLCRWTEASPPPGSHADGAPAGQIATVAWMIVFGDGLHNFIDGLSIGAAFSESIMSGISVSVAVVCEEFPHELGDFAVLLASGMTLRQAIGYNFLSACSCYVGMALGILIGDLSHASSYVLALAGGMFLYIALVDMMSELSSAVQLALKQSKTLTCKVIALQHLGILIGIGSLFLLAKYSEQIKFEGFAPPRIPTSLH
jgi:zinc transporter 14